jgi:hypothetical protein
VAAFDDLNRAFLEFLAQREMNSQATHMEGMLKRFAKEFDYHTPLITEQFGPGEIPWPIMARLRERLKDEGYTVDPVSFSEPAPYDWYLTTKGHRRISWWCRWVDMVKNDPIIGALAALVCTALGTWLGIILTK